MELIKAFSLQNYCYLLHHKYQVYNCSKVSDGKFVVTIFVNGFTTEPGSIPFLQLNSNSNNSNSNSIPNPVQNP